MPPSYAPWAVRPFINNPSSVRANDDRLACARLELTWSASLSVLLSASASSRLVNRTSTGTSTYTLRRTTMLVRALPIFLALLALLALTAEARPFRGAIQNRQLTVEERDMTNGERLARGLPLKAPVMKRIMPGREPTPVKRGTHSASASPSPSPSPSAVAVT